MAEGKTKSSAPSPGAEVKSHGDLQYWFISNIIEPYLREEELGIIAEEEELVKQNRSIDRLEYDAKIGDLLFEFKKPGEQVRGKRDIEKYIKAFKERGEEIECFVTNGEQAVYVDRTGKEQQRGSLKELLPTLKELLSTHIPKSIDPKYLVKRFGSHSAICRVHVTSLWELLEKTEGSSNEVVRDLISDCLGVWKRVYAEAANLNREAMMEVKKYADSFGIEIKSDKHDVEKFLFVIETYVSIFMELFIAGLVTQNKLIDYRDICDLLGRLEEGTTEAFNAFRRLPFMKGVFEYDVFDWFTEPAMEDPESKRRVENIIWNLGKAIDRVELSGVETDLFRKIYQEFFDKGARKALGEFYTNEDLVEEVLDSIGYEGEKILDRSLLDPACGSGTFLLIAISRFKKEAREKGWKEQKILEKIIESIYGIDIHPFAVTMAKVNYLLAISDLLKEAGNKIREFELPIYWSDSLSKFSKFKKLTKGVEVEITPFGKLELPEPDDLGWDILFRKIRKGVERKHPWSTDIFLDDVGNEVRLTYERILTTLYEKFKLGEIDSRWLPVLRNMLAVHKFKERCDFVVGNPPWVRLRNVDKDLRKRLREEFDFYQGMWNPPLKKIKFFRGSMDYSVAFVESGLKYLKDGGYLGFVITSNVTRNLYAGKFRERLIRNCALLTIKDYSFSRRPLFEEAQNAPLILSLEKRKPSKDHKLKVSIVNRNEEWRDWTIDQSELPLLKRDPESLWMIAPPEVILVIRKMIDRNPMLGNIYSVNMGVKTAANDVFWIKEFKRTDRWPKVAYIETTGGERVVSQKARIETDVIRPLVRGRNIDPWDYDVENYIIWTHDDETGEVKEELPPNAEAYFNRENVKERLKSRKAATVSKPLEKGAPHWLIGDVSAQKLMDKVAFQGIAKKIEAVFVPSSHYDKQLGRRKSILDANVYFIPVKDKNMGYILSAFLNSTLVRTYYSAYAMRTGAQYCAFRSWMMGLIPLAKEHKELATISRKLHEVKGEDRELLRKLDKRVANLYDLTEKELSAMEDFHDFFIAG